MSTESDHAQDYEDQGHADALAEFDAYEALVNSADADPVGGTNLGGNPMSEKINPADCKPGEWYEGTVDGERVVTTRAQGIMFISRPTCSYPTMTGVTNRRVSELVRLLPARPATAEDLPDLPDELPYVRDLEAKDTIRELVTEYRDRSVDLLNKRGGLGIDTREQLERALRERDTERDEALSRAENAESDASDLEKQREVLITRAETAERERDGLGQELTYSRALVERAQREQASAEHERDAALSGRLYWRDQAVTTRRERDAAVERAEKAEAKPDVFQWDADRAAPAITPVNDPAVFTIHESEIAAVEVKRYDNEGWQARSPGLTSGYGRHQESAKMDVDRYRAELLNALAVTRAIEAEQSADPVEELARELYEVANPGTLWKAVVASSAEMGSGMDIQVVREYRAIAAHVVKRDRDQS